MFQAHFERIQTLCLYIRVEQYTVDPVDNKFFLDSNKTVWFCKTLLTQL